MRTAIICGGSIGGLFAAVALMRAGWHVDVYERTSVELSGRGAGIVTHSELLSALRTIEADIDQLGVEVTERVAFDLSGARVRTLDYQQIVTSWDRIHQILRAKIPNARHHLGWSALGYTVQSNGVEVAFANGKTRKADMVVGADGFRSAIRAQMLPAVQPEFSGYVVWRALANERDLPADVHAQVFENFGFFLPTGAQVIGYPIAGLNNDLRPGHRRYNFVWYAPVTDPQLDDMLTDATGHRHDISIPPPLVRDDVLFAMEKDARARLPKPFVDMLAISERPFFTPIYDHHSPVMAAGRVALVGDAACVARPHVGMGVTKAADDALALARYVAASPLAEALQAYSRERVAGSRVAYDRAQLLGSYIFEEPESGTNDDGRSNANIEEIMRLTAVVAK